MATSRLKEIGTALRKCKKELESMLKKGQGEDEKAVRYARRKEILLAEYNKLVCPEAFAAVGRLVRAHAEFVEKNVLLDSVFEFCHENSSGEKLVHSIRALSAAAETVHAAVCAVRDQFSGRLDPVLAAYEVARDNFQAAIEDADMRHNIWLVHGRIGTKADDLDGPIKALLEASKVESERKANAVSR